MRNQNWSRDEHILALDFYLRHTPHIPAKDSPEVIGLSKLLNRLQDKLGSEKFDTFRNPSGVYMKLMNFRRFDPGYHGAGLENGSKDEEVVWNLYATKPQELASLARHIVSFAGSDSDEPSETLPALGPDEEEGNEGSILSRVHRYRERNHGLVEKKKAQVLYAHKRLFCEACGFDFEKAYGERGAGFIECHHTKPVSELQAGEKTKVVDLALLCSNCHRIVHRRRPWLTLAQLKSGLNSS